MNATNVAVRTLDAAEVETLVAWAALEGWNPGIADAACFRAADPGGFLGAFREGDMVSGISGVRYGEHFGFIGLYICRSDMRGNGYGKAVWDACMAMLGGRTIGLDGVLEQQPNYRCMGFEPAYRTFRWSGKPSGGSRDVRHIRAATANDVEAIAALDRRIFPADRRAFSDRWLAPPHQALVYGESGAITGYGVLRRCQHGYKIGPLTAQDFGAARDLFWSLNALCRGELHLDVPETQADFANLLSTAGLAKGFETARMYRGTAPHVEQGELYAVTTLELG
jgi:hypothetical protein